METQASMTAIEVSNTFLRLPPRCDPLPPTRGSPGLGGLDSKRHLRAFLEMSMSPTPSSAPFSQPPRVKHSGRNVRVAGARLVGVAN